MLRNFRAYLQSPEGDSSRVIQGYRPFTMGQDPIEGVITWKGQRSLGYARETAPLLPLTRGGF